jgi:hypothetical protein
MYVKEWHNEGPRSDEKMSAWEAPKNHGEVCRGGASEY